MGHVNQPRRATIRIFLLDGTPAGPRTVERLGWTGHAIVCSRTSYPDIRSRPEFDRTGVYALVASEAESMPSLYIGEADVARVRLDDHLRNREDWTELVLFTSQSGHVNKALAKNLESRLVELGRAAKRARIENSNLPPAPQLHESEEAEVENFLDEMLNIFPLIGIAAFQTPKLSTASMDSIPELELKIGKARAFGRDLPEGFLVKRGAVATTVLAPSFARTLAADLRMKLLTEGVLVEKGKECVLTQDYLFGSPSLAAALLVGYPISGPQAWKDKRGRTLKEIQSARI